jgi:hypothetical protein
LAVMPALRRLGDGAVCHRDRSLLRALMATAAPSAARSPASCQGLPCD